MGTPGGVSLRVVFDTNVVVSALLFSRGRLAWLRDVWRDARAVPLVSRPTAAELLRVLGYPKFGLTAAEQESLLMDYLPFAEVVAPPARKPLLPPCRDPHDQPFLELVVAAGANALISGDADLLSLTSCGVVPIIAPEALRQMLGES